MRGSSGNPRLDDVLSRYAATRVSGLTPEAIKADLASQGINSLDDLIKGSMDDLTKGGQIAATTFIYEQFIYRSGRVIDDVVLDAIESQIQVIRGKIR